MGDVINKTYKRQKLTMRDFYCFRIQQRLNEGKTLLLAGRLLQQYIVDGYMAIEEERFHYIWNNQPKLRADLYSGLMDAILRGDSDCSLVGKNSYLTFISHWRTSLSGTKLSRCNGNLQVGWISRFVPHFHMQSKVARNK